MASKRSHLELMQILWLGNKLRLAHLTDQKEERSWWKRMKVLKAPKQP